MQLKMECFEEDYEEDPLALPDVHDENKLYLFEAEMTHEIHSENDIKHEWHLEEQN